MRPAERPAAPVAPARPRPTYGTAQPDPLGRPSSARQPHSRARSDDLLTMQRLASRTGGARLLLGWLSERTGYQTRLLDRRGALRHLVPARGRRAPIEPVAGPADVERVAVSGPRSVVLTRGNLIEYLIRIEDGDERGNGIVLSVVGMQPTPEGLSVLVGDAARLVGLAWRAEEAQRARIRMAQATARGREAVLELLMSGNVSAAEHVAAALGPRLTSPVHVYIADCAFDNRAAAAGAIDAATGGRAWVVPYPMSGDHLVALVPTAVFERSSSSGHPADPASVGALLAARVPDCVAAASDSVSLGAVAAGHAQALRRLNQARQTVEYAGLEGAGTGYPENSLPSLTGIGGTAWAREFLAPLDTYQPRRRTDPDSPALTETLLAWLNLGGSAAQQLYMHRNTLTARLRLLREVLGLDLSSIGDQAMLSLALRINGSSTHVVASPPAGMRPAAASLAALDTVLDNPAVHSWARHELRGLPADDTALEMVTLRTWLAHNARLPATASALGISVPGARKRLARIERLMSRRLLNTPGERHDLWLAMRVREKTGTVAESTFPTELSA